MSGSARIRISPGGESVVVVPGDVVGRGLRADVSIRHPGVSELHAFFSVRTVRDRPALVLLEARGGLYVRGRITDRVVLEPGVEVSFGAPAAAGVTVPSLRVEEVYPPEGLKLRVGSGAPAPLLPDDAGYVLDAAGAIRRAAPTEPADLWWSEDGWHSASGPVEPGTMLLAGRTVEVLAVAPISAATTQRPVEALRFRWRVLSERLTVEDRNNRVIGTFHDRPGLILRWLFWDEAGRPTPATRVDDWREIADRIWGDDGPWYETFRRLRNTWDGIAPARPFVGHNRRLAVELLAGDERVWDPDPIRPSTPRGQGRQG